MGRMAHSLAPAPLRPLPAPLRRPPAIARGAGPIVKWVGGKTRLLGELAARAPTSFRRYLEPFVGGAALFFHLRPRAALLSDTNAELIACYRAVQDEVDAVIAALERHREQHSEAYYSAVRYGWNADARTAPAERAAAFLYLNKTCYNGLWRVNSRGRFNVPAGRYVNPSILDAERLRAASAALRGAACELAPFEAVLDEARGGDFVYFDPPYHPLSATADFTSYTAAGFTAADQERLASVFARLDDRGCAVMLSNSDTPFTRRLYARWRVERVLAPRAINSRADRRGAVGEIIVRNRY
jgi:DNA adenine methylase